MSANTRFTSERPARSDIPLGGMRLEEARKRNGNQSRTSQFRNIRFGYQPGATKPLTPQIKVIPIEEQLLFEEDPTRWRALYGTPMPGEEELANVVKAEAIADSLIDDDGTPAAAAT
jgi:hypothetical protein